MGQVIRKVLALVAACGLAANIMAYVGSYKGTTFDSLVLWPFALHLGVFIVTVPMIVIEYSAFTNKIPAWMLFFRGRPIQRGTFSWAGVRTGFVSRTRPRFPPR